MQPEIIHPRPDTPISTPRPRPPTPAEVAAHAAAHGSHGGALWRLRGSRGLALSWWLEVGAPSPGAGLAEYVSRYGEIVSAAPVDLRGRAVSWPDVAEDLSERAARVLGTDHTAAGSLSGDLAEALSRLERQPITDAVAVRTLRTLRAIWRELTSQEPPALLLCEYPFRLLTSDPRWYLVADPVCGFWLHSPYADEPEHIRPDVVVASSDPEAVAAALGVSL